MYPTSAPHQQEHEDAGIDLRKLLGALLDHKWPIIGVTALFCLGGALYGMFATPIYRTTALVQIEKKSGTVPGLEMGGDVNAQTSSARTEIELLRSRSVIGQAVDNLHLDVRATPQRFPLIGDYLARRHRGPGLAEPFLGLEEYAWGGEKIEVLRFEVDPQWAGKRLVVTAADNGAFNLQDGEGRPLLQGRVGEAIDQQGIRLQIHELQARPGTRFTLSKGSRLSTIRTYRGALQLSEVGGDTGLITVAMNHPDPRHASRVVDEISRLFVRQNVERMSAEVDGSLEFLRTQLPEVRRDLEKAEDALNDYRKRHGSVDIGMETGTVLNQAVGLETRLSELRMQQAELDRRFTREHPAYKTLLMQIHGLTQRRNEIARRMQGLPETQQELLRLSRDVQVSTAIYTQLLSRTQELDLVRAATIGNVRIVDQAVIEGGTVAPDKTFILVVATLVGALLAIGVVLLRKLLNPGLETPEAIEQLGLPVYAAVPFSEHQAHFKPRRRRAAGSPAQVSPLLALGQPHDPAVEALRSLRTSLHFIMLGAQDNRLAISGPGPQAGKSFVCANLAAVVAQTGKRVLLVDVDMRKGQLHRLLGMEEAGTGLSDLLDGRCDLADAIRATPVEGLFLLSRGQIPPNPSELLMHSNFSAVLQQASASHDLVILDTPPLLAVTDAAIVGRQAATTLIVARFGVSSAREIELTVRRFAQNGIEIKGAIFNGMEKRAGTYGYGHAAYYHYEYKPDNA
ncbi:polysaccharide biosynthesis tyrosine autokinase [Azotobacter chroococcum]|uniref:Tyrosine-protein kinase Etk/Wzc n=1 Tax=Azotobacter chroococcum TaxID=353 RepID=A0A4R1PV15_9GAMM|nr:polysaccharide biosynthesis tyrosine autokinase [Azotobacter chroococcum]TBV98718.1 polysaccharide biosynthesis tyrosine autokinase [Azotobacter chroococcum]TCL34647.1 tyrosine-protein kinase Etk/Wzc [Azotobacter chroococcum]